MKRVLLAGAALTGVFVTQAFAAEPAKPIVIPKAPAPVAAPSPTSGYVELYGQWMSTANGYWGSSYDPWSGLGGAGRVNWWLSPTTSVQVDFQGMGIGDYDFEDLGWEAAGFAHLSHRNANHLWGVFIGDSVSTDYDWYYYAANNFSVGAEAQAYFGNLTLYGQVGYLKTTKDYEGDLSSMWFGNLEGRFFLTPNTKLAANVGFATGDVFDDGSSYSLVNYGAEIEQRFGMTPLSAFFRWDGYSYYGYLDNVFKAGVRVAIGQPDLITQDRKGATLKVDDLSALWIRLNDCTSC